MCLADSAEEQAGVDLGDLYLVLEKTGEVDEIQTVLEHLAVESLVDVHLAVVQWRAEVLVHYQAELEQTVLTVVLADCLTDQPEVEHTAVGQGGVYWKEDFGVD